MGRPWEPEEDAIVAELYASTPNGAIVAALAERGYARTRNAVLSRGRALGLRKDREAGYVKAQPRRFWTPDRAEWFRGFVPGHTEGEISAEHERLWGSPLTAAQIGNAKRALGVRSGTHGGRFGPGHVPANKGRTWDEAGLSEEARRNMGRGLFAKGHRPHNQHELLAIRRVRDRQGRVYTQIKVDPRNARHPMGYWLPYERFVWMQANGRDWPEGCRALFVDGDRENFDPDNVYPCPAELYPMVMGAVKGQVGWHDRETLDVAVLSARVTLARSRLRKSARKRG